MIIRLTLGAGIALFLTASCGIHMAGPGHAPGPVLVYKTKQDYREHVTVQLSDDGRSVVAYPGPGDVMAQRPVELADGYLLKRMVGNHWSFSFTGLVVMQRTPGQVMTE